MCGACALRGRLMCVCARGRWGTDINTGVNHVYMKMGPCLAVLRPVPPPHPEKKRQEENFYMKANLPFSGNLCF